jgi:hypothetical protein
MQGEFAAPNAPILLKRAQKPRFRRRCAKCCCLFIFPSGESGLSSIWTRAVRRGPITPKKLLKPLI